MPAFLENALRHEGKKKGFTGRALDRYVFGAMNHMGAMKGNKITAKGEAMEEKHERDTGGLDDAAEEESESNASVVERALSKVNAR